MNRNATIKERYIDLMNCETKYLSIRYKGKGRPCKTDYTVCKMKDVLDMKAFEMLSHGGFRTEYIHN